MDERIKKVVRTLQSEFPFLKEAKDGFYLHARRLLRIPHETDFRALTFIASSLQGCYVDVGANQGQSIESILLFKPDAQIVSFEANPTLAKMLEVRYRNRENIRVIAKGLGDSVGRFKLFVPSYKGFGYDALASFDKESAVSWINEHTVLRFNPDKLTLSEIECQLDTLDRQQLAPAFIKLDVQGYEYNVLEGARETLRQYEPVVLIETFRNDLRSVRLAEELGYEEYHYDGSSLQKGSPITGPNSFLITPGRLKTLRI